MTCSLVRATCCGGKKNPLDRGPAVCKTAGFPDKVLKLGAAVSDLTEKAITHHHGKGDPRALMAGKVADYMKVARTVTGLFNIFRGVLQGIPAAVKSVYLSVKTYGKDVEIKIGPRGPFNTALSKTEKVLAAVENSGQFVAATTFTWSFGVARVVKFAEMIGVKLSHAAKSVKDSFCFAMMANHIGALIANIVGWVREAISLDRLKAEYRANPTKEIKLPKGVKLSAEQPVDLAERALADLDREAVQSGVRHAVTIAEKAVELALDTVHCGVPIPLMVQASLNVVVGVTAVINLWVGGFESPDRLASA